MFVATSESYFALSMSQIDKNNMMKMAKKKIQEQTRYNGKLVQQGLCMGS